MKANDIRELASKAKFYEGYSRFMSEENRYETWEDSVERVGEMHRTKYKDIWNDTLEDYLQKVLHDYKNQSIVGAQRALQFGGDQILKHEAKLYNCLSSYADRANFFGEYMYLLLAGCGVGFSVQNHHTAKLPNIRARSNYTVNYEVPDSIEGWAEAVDVLLSSYFEDGGVHSKYKGRKVYFDFSKIRPRGAYISGGFKAPGPDPLRRSISKIEDLINKRLDEGYDRLKNIDVYDICMHCSDAVLSGGIRRAASICMFSPDDYEMMQAKTGNWFIDNPQRARSNNSVILVRDETPKEKLYEIMEYIKEYGEPGFIFTESTEFTFNPCVEIGKFPVTKDGKSGFQGCNLSSINGSHCNSPEEFYRYCETAAIIGTLQAGYTNFRFLSKESREIFEREALLGVSITGWMNNPDVLFNDDVMRKGAEIVKETNKKIAKLIGINPAARTTCTKPEGNTSVLLKTASGIHGEHAPYYLRHVQMNKDTEVAKLIADKYPSMVEDSVWNPNRTDYCIAFPVVSPEGSVYREELYGIKQLEFVKKAQQNWVEHGTNVDLCTDKRIRHNVSNTITVDDWDKVTDYIFDNKEWFAGISFVPMSGDKDYPQAPNAQVKTEDQIIEEYGSPSMFASGLICSGLDAFDNNLWMAISTALGHGEDISEENHDNMLKRDFVNRFKKFSRRYFDNDVQKCADCLKDVHYLHKWEKIQNETENVDLNWIDELKEKEYVDVDTMGAQACSAAGGCEI